MHYPEILLPNIQYKKIESDLSGFLLIRKTETKDIINPSTLTLKDEVITFEQIHLIDYSVNLLGEFEVDHLKYKIIGNNRQLYNSYWDFKTRVSTPKENEDFLIELGYGFFLLPIEKLNGSTFPFQKGNEKEFVAKLLVVHKPTKCNFWHFEVRWHLLNPDEDFEEFKRNKKAKWQFILTATLKSKIKQYFIDKLPERISTIPVSYYK
ncbi:MAG: hypothetical protein ACOCWG_05005 [bacterium]